MPDIFLYAGEANPNDIRLRDPTVADSGAGSVTVTFTQTDEADTLASAALVAVALGFLATDAADTLASTALTAVAATLTATDEADSVASSAAVGIVATATLTDEGDALASQALVALAAGLTTTDESDLLVSAATMAVGVDLALTDESDTLSSSAAAQATEVLGGGGSGRAVKPKRRYVARIGGRLMVFGSQAAAAAMIDSEETPNRQPPEIVGADVPDGLEQIELPQVKAYAKLAGRVHEYNQAYNSNHYQALIALFEQMRDEEDIELLLMHA